jgi:hypothetical protein
VFTLTGNLHLFFIMAQQQLAQNEAAARSVESTDCVSATAQVFSGGASAARRNIATVTSVFAADEEDDASDSTSAAVGFIYGVCRSARKLFFGAAQAEETATD